MAYKAKNNYTCTYFFVPLKHVYILGMTYTIHALWDKDAEVWTAQSKDIPGLVLESGSLDVLMERAKYAIPELLELNGTLRDSVSVLFTSHHLIF